MVGPMNIPTLIVVSGPGSTARRLGREGAHAVAGCAGFDMVSPSGATGSTGSQAQPAAYRARRPTTRKPSDLYSWSAGLSTFTVSQHQSAPSAASAPRTCATSGRLAAAHGMAGPHRPGRPRCQAR